MSKRSKRHNKKRGSHITANRPPNRLLPRLRFPVPLNIIEDNRTPRFPLTRLRAHKLITSLSITPRRVSRPTHQSWTSPLKTPSLKLPREAVICLRRSIRKEVLFATGKGGSKHKRKYRRTEHSKIICRRK